MSRHPLRALASVAALLVLLTAAARAADPAPKPDDPAPKADAAAIVGTWKVTSMNVGGKEVMGEVGPKKMELRFDETTATPIEDGKEKDKEKAQYKLDPAKTPREITITEPKGKVMKGLYELKGDALTIAFAEDENGPPPADLLPGAGKGILKLERVK